jgi:hypothetical protein
MYFSSLTSGAFLMLGTLTGMLQRLRGSLEYIPKLFHVPCKRLFWQQLNSGLNTQFRSFRSELFLSINRLMFEREKEKCIKNCQQTSCKCRYNFLTPSILSPTWISPHRFLGCKWFYLVICVSVTSWYYFWDVTPCSLVEVDWRFGVTSYLNFHGLRVSRNSYQNYSTCWLTNVDIRQCRWKQSVTPKLYGVPSHFSVKQRWRGANISLTEVALTGASSKVCEVT